MLEAWPEPKQVVERWVVGSAKAGEPKETCKVMRETLLIIALNGGPVMEMLCDESGAARTAFAPGVVLLLLLLMLMLL